MGWGGGGGSVSQQTWHGPGPCPALDKVCVCVRGGGSVSRRGMDQDLVMYGALNVSNKVN